MNIPELPALRPMRMVELLDQAIRLYRRNFFKFLGIIAIVYIPVSALPLLGSWLMVSPVMTPTAFDFTGGMPAGYWTGMGLTLISAVLQFVLVQGLGTAALTSAIADNYLGRPISIADAYRRIGASWGKLLGALGLGALIMLGLVVATLLPCVGWLVGPGLLVFISIVTFPLIAPVVVIEKTGASAGLWRAWDLSRRRFWWILGYMLLLSLFGQLIVTGPSLVARYLVTVLGGEGSNFMTQSMLGALAQIAVQIVTGVLYIPLQLSAVTMGYFDLRVRTEGFDLALLAAADTQQTGLEAASQAPVMAAPRPLLTWQEAAYFLGLTVAATALYALLWVVLFAVMMAFMGPMLGGMP